MISKEDRRIFDEFSDRIRSRFPKAQLWVFGSRARGDGGWDSDFDIFIVLDVIDNEIDRWIRDVAWQIGFDNDRVITTIIMDEKQFNYGPMSESTLVANVLREGVSS